MQNNLCLAQEVFMKWKIGYKIKELASAPRCEGNFFQEIYLSRSKSGRIEKIHFSEKIPERILSVAW